MIILDSTTKSLEIVLGGSVTTNQLPFVSSAVDITSAAFNPVSSDGLSNNTTAVAVVASPASGISRQLKFLSVENADTANATVTVQLNNSGMKRIIFKASLTSGYTLIYNHDKGFCVYDTNGVAQGGGGSGGGSSFYQTVQAAGSSQAQRAKLNFLAPLAASDNSGNGSTDISLPTAPQTLTDASTVTWNMASGANASLILTTGVGASRNLTITNAASGQCYTLAVQQASTGGQAVTFSGITVKVAGAGGGAITLSTANNAIDILSFYYDGTTFYCTYANTFT